MPAAVHYYRTRDGEAATMLEGLAVFSFVVFVLITVLIFVLMILYLAFHYQQTPLVSALMAKWKATRTHVAERQLPEWCRCCCGK